MLSYVNDIKLKQINKITDSSRFNFMIVCVLVFSNVIVPKSRFKTNCIFIILKYSSNKSL